MRKQTIVYTNLNGEEKSQDFFFHLNKAELAMMELEKDGGLSKTLERIVKTEDTKEISTIFKDIILNAYGYKSADGERFVKSEEAKLEFSQSEAYSELFVSLCTDGDFAAAFINDVVGAKPTPNIAPVPQ